MKVRSKVLQFLHLDPSYSVLNARSLMIALEFFKAFDIHKKMGLNDIQFWQFMCTVTDLSKSQIYKIFDMLDFDASGEIEFDEFYLIICILISNQDNEEKQFIYRHSRTVFDLLDEDGSKSISADEFENFGFVFNFQSDTVRRIFHEFDVSGDQELDYQEFRMFAMACIDKQKELREMKKLKRLQGGESGLRGWIQRCLGRDRAQEEDVRFLATSDGNQNQPRPKLHIADSILDVKY